MIKCTGSITRAFFLGSLLAVFITLAGCDLIAGDTFAAWLLAFGGLAVTGIAAQVTDNNED